MSHMHAAQRNSRPLLPLLTPMRSFTRCLRIVIEASVTYLATTSTTYPAGKLLQII